MGVGIPYSVRELGNGWITRRWSVGSLLPRFLQEEKEERLTKSTVLFMRGWFSAKVQNIYPNRTHLIPIHSIYVLTPTPASWWSPSPPPRPRRQRGVGGWLPQPEVEALQTSTGPPATCGVSVSSRSHTTSLWTSCQVQEDVDERQGSPTSTSRRRSSTNEYGTNRHLWSLRKFKQPQM
jgi:hypothetical protein